MLTTKIRYFVLILSLLIPSLAQAQSNTIVRDQNNKIDVQNSLANGDWQIRFLSEFDKADTARFSDQIESTGACFDKAQSLIYSPPECYKHMGSDFAQNIEQTAKTIVSVVDSENINTDFVLEAALKSLTSRTPQSLSKFEIHIGLAVYQNWSEITIQIPETRMQIRDLGFGIKTKIPTISMKNLTERIEQQNTFQPFIRWRVIEGDESE